VQYSNAVLLTVSVFFYFSAGAQIIDLMMLVVDITKGVQTQTAECLVIGEITCDKMIVVLNKIDMIPVDKRPATIDRVGIHLWFLKMIHYL
jgi:selenocysteine-specific translation elongation factor